MYQKIIKHFRSSYWSQKGEKLLVLLGLHGIDRCMTETCVPPQSPNHAVISLKRGYSIRQVLRIFLPDL